MSASSHQVISQPQASAPKCAKSIEVNHQFDPHRAYPLSKMDVPFKTLLALKEFSTHMLLCEGFRVILDKLGQLSNVPMDDSLPGVRDKQTFRRFMHEPESVKIASLYTLDQCAKQLRLLKLHHLIQIRLNQPEMGTVPDSMGYQQQFLHEIDRQIYRRVAEELIQINSTPPDSSYAQDPSSSDSSASTESLSYLDHQNDTEGPGEGLQDMLDLLATNSHIAIKTKHALGNEILLTLGIASLHQNQYPELMDSWWRLVVERPLEFGYNTSKSQDNSGKSRRDAFAEDLASVRRPGTPSSQEIYPRANSFNLSTKYNNAKGRHLERSAPYPQDQHPVAQPIDQLERFKDNFPGRVLSQKTRDPVESEEPSSERRGLDFARSQSAQALRRTLKETGKDLLDLYLNVKTLKWSDTRPLTCPVHLFRSTNWIGCQILHAGPVTAARSALTITGEVLRVYPSASMYQFFRPSDATAAIHAELSSKVQHHGQSKTFREYVGGAPLAGAEEEDDCVVSSHLKSSLKAMGFLSKFGIKPLATEISCAESKSTAASTRSADSQKTIKDTGSALGSDTSQKMTGSAAASTDVATKSSAHESTTLCLASPEPSQSSYVQRVISKLNSLNSQQDQQRSRDSKFAKPSSLTRDIVKLSPPPTTSCDVATPASPVGLSTLTPYKVSFSETRQRRKEIMEAKEVETQPQKSAQQARPPIIVSPRNTSQGSPLMTTEMDNRQALSDGIVNDLKPNFHRARSDFSSQRVVALSRTTTGVEIVTTQPVAHSASPQREEETICRVIVANPYEEIRSVPTYISTSELIVQDQPKSTTGEGTRLPPAEPRPQSSVKPLKVKKKTKTPKASASEGKPAIEKAFDRNESYIVLQLNEKSSQPLRPPVKPQESLQSLRPEVKSQDQGNADKIVVKKVRKVKKVVPGKKKAKDTPFSRVQDNQPVQKASPNALSDLPSYTLGNPVVYPASTSKIVDTMSRPPTRPQNYGGVSEMARPGPKYTDVAQSPLPRQDIFTLHQYKPPAPVQPPTLMRQDAKITRNYSQDLHHFEGLEYPVHRSRIPHMSQAIIEETLQTSHLVHSPAAPSLRMNSQYSEYPFRQQVAATTTRKEPLSDSFSGTRIFCNSETNIHSKPDLRSGCQINSSKNVQSDQY